MPPRTPPNPTALVEVRTKQVDDLADRLAMLNEVVGKRQDEADALKNALMSTQMQIASTKRQWQQQQAQEKNAFAVWQHEQEESLALQQNAINERERRAQEGWQQMEAMKEELRQRMYSVEQQRQAFATLGQDRLDTAKLKAQAEAKMQEAQTFWAQAQHAQNEANGKVTDAKALETTCEVRNQQMQHAWNQIAAKEEELRLRERDVSLRESALKMASVEAAA